MPSHHLEHDSPYTCKQLFDMVADIKSYPEFLPWASAARILKENKSELEAELVINFKAFSSSYISHVALNPPKNKNGECSINVELIEGPFEHLVNNWKFKPAKQGSEIIFDIDFAFKSKILEKMIGGVFDKATIKMLGAFEQRADKLYR